MPFRALFRSGDGDVISNVSSVPALCYKTYRPYIGAPTVCTHRKSCTPSIATQRVNLSRGQLLSWAFWLLGYETSSSMKKASSFFHPPLALSTLKPRGFNAGGPQGSPTIRFWSVSAFAEPTAPYSLFADGLWHSLRNDGTGGLFFHPKNLLPLRVTSIPC